ncbi:MAG: transcriptional regulator, TetR family [Verrucomicrobia bacterium]|nr:transcriptional regulator, TetR family [Verrucomicrobiota bacterium]
MKTKVRPRTPRPPPARQRLLEAAAHVFARDGLSGATTRAIAREAGVNEVTLFRLFQSKDLLLAAVVGKNFGPESQANSPIPAPTADLRADLVGLAEIYNALLVANLPLVRTMIGEIHHHHRDQERQVFQAIFLPVKNALLARLKLAEKAGELRKGMRPDLLTDLFGGMIFTGALRRGSPHFKLAYSPADYVSSAIDLVIDGATVS